MAGWIYQLGDAASGAAVIGGRIICTSQIQGVITLLPWVGPQDLPGIHPEDREYVAAEMSAFLLAWLSELPCPVLNRPSPSSLSGPGWRHDHWIRVASRLGIPTTLPDDSNALGAPALSGRPVTVLDGQPFGTCQPAEGEAAAAIARSVDVRLVTLSFVGTKQVPVFEGAWPAPRLDDSEMAHLLKEKLLKEGRRS
jgi:hypothetical protein